MIPNPWLIIGALVFYAVSLVSVGAWQRADGAAAERVKWQAHENAALLAANSRIEQLNREARALERASAAELANLGETYAKERETLEERRRRDVAAARDGAIRLRDPGAHAACPSGPAAPLPAAPAGDGPAPGDLSGSASAFLLDLANEADGVAEQLAAAQDVIRAQQRACNPKGATP